MASLDPSVGTILGSAIWIIFLILIIGLATYIYSAIAIMALAKKTNTEYNWLAWIPIARYYLLTQIAEVPWWTFLAFLLILVPMVGGIAFIATNIWWWWKISERRNKPGWWSILMIIPIVNLIIMGILAWQE